MKLKTLLTLGDQVIRVKGKGVYGGEKVQIFKLSSTPKRCGHNWLWYGFDAKYPISGNVNMEGQIGIYPIHQPLSNDPADYDLEAEVQCQSFGTVLEITILSPESAKELDLTFSYEGIF